MNREGTSPGFDLSGLNAFWKIMGKLEKDELPGDAEWEAMFATPGYRLLLTQGFSAQFFREKFIQAFMPSMAEKMGGELESDRWYLLHYLRIREKRNAIKRHLDSLDYAGITESALSAASSFLPESDDTRYAGLPKVAIVVFKYDARGGHDPIVMDALASMEWGDLTLFLGHELHHYLRNSLPNALNFMADDSLEACLMNRMISIESEGIADLINRDQQCSSEGWTKIQERYRGLLELVPDSIRFLDQWIIRNFRDFSTPCGNTSDELSSRITDSGHQMGYYMAKAILRHFPRENLIATVGSPFDFFKLYHESADAEGLPCFSEKSLEILQHLGEKHSTGRK